MSDTVELGFCYLCGHPVIGFAGDTEKKPAHDACVQVRNDALRESSEVIERLRQLVAEWIPANQQLSKEVESLKQKLEQRESESLRWAKIAGQNQTQIDVLAEDVERLENELAWYRAGMLIMKDAKNELP